MKRMDQSRISLRNSSIVNGPCPLPSRISLRILLIRRSAAGVTSTNSSRPSFTVRRINELIIVPSGNPNEAAVCFARSLSFLSIFTVSNVLVLVFITKVYTSVYSRQVPYSLLELPESLLPLDPLSLDGDSDGVSHPPLAPAPPDSPPPLCIDGEDSS